MLSPYTIKDLYALALAEGEGMGTAYEYYAKRLALGRWLKDRPRPASILVAGLPEKYGASLDFLLLAGELGATVTVVDDRPAALARLTTALEALAGTALPVAMPVARVLADLPHMATLAGHYDLAVSSEVLQRLAAAERPAYVAALRARAGALALFAPNADNPAHTNRSGLSSLHLDELPALLTNQPPPPHDRQLTTDNYQLTAGYIDMPPFPPGITRSDEQREQATQGAFEAAVMSGLRVYAHGERFLPGALRRRQSHIVYGLAD